jgi:hypothetical protein
VADDSPNSTPIQVDGVWRPEPWTNGRFLLVRYVQNEHGTARRQVHNGSEHSAYAVIYESQTSAAADAKRLNEAEIARLLPPEDEEPTPQTKETDQ